MNDQYKTKAQLIAELDQTRTRVAELEQVEAALRGSEEKYRTLFENVSDQIIYVNKYGTILSASDRDTTFGRKPEEIIGKNFTKLGYFDVKDIPKYLKLFKDVITGKKTVVGMELGIKHKDGHKVPVEVSTSLVKKNGRIEGFLCIVKEITERKRAEEALRESEAKYRTLVDTMMEGLAIGDPDENLVFVNQACCEMLGYNEEELLGMNLRQIMPPDEFEKVLQETELRKRGLKSTYETRFNTKKGELRTFLVSAAPHYGAQGEFSGAVVAIHDITERKQAEETIQGRLELMKLASELSSAFITIPLSQIDDEINSTLKKVAQVAGAKRSSLFLVSDDLTTLANTHEWCVNPSDSQIELLQGIPFETFGYHGKQLRNHETIAISSIDDYPPEAKGEIEWIKKYGVRSMLFIPIIQKGKLYGALGFYGEIGKEIKWPDFFIEFLKVIGDVFVSALERKQAEETLRESEERFRQIVERSSDVFYRQNINTIKFEYVSPKVIDLLGITPEEMRSMDFDEQAARIHPDDLPNLIDFSKDLVKADNEGVGSIEREFRIMHKSGEYRWIHGSYNLTRDVNGEPDFVVGGLQDITERKQVEEELKRSNKELKQFAFSASHDLQEPLRTITSFAQLLSERYKGQLDSSADEYLHYIVEGATQISDRVKGLLAVSRIEAKAVSLENVSLEAVLQQVLAGLKNLVEQSHAEITWDTLPEIRANRDQMAQLLQNLIENALKFRGTEDPRVHISSRTTTSTWEFCMQDNGIGIEPKYHERIFDLFNRVSRKDEHAGTGIGLAICQRIVERHGGRIWVESEGEGKGSRFCTSISKQVRQYRDQETASA